MPVNQGGISSSAPPQSLSGNKTEMQNFQALPGVNLINFRMIAQIIVEDKFAILT
jgi:hypothetical protein